VLGTTRIGSFVIDSIAGVADPRTACDARALSILPPLLRFPGPPETEGGYLVPADLLR
jgi:hypothetical protein